MTFRRVQRGRWHSYELDGRRVPGVTTLIRDGLPKPNLIDWAAKDAAGIAHDRMDELARLERDAFVGAIVGEREGRRRTAGVKGTEIHDLARRLGDGETVAVPETVAGYVDAYLRFVEDWQPEPIAVEGPVANRRWRYGGSFDLLAHFRRAGLISLVDIKTGGSGVWPETCLQIAAYRAAEVMLDVDGREVRMPHTDAGHALWLGDDGSYELLPIESGPDVFAVFLHVCHVAQFMTIAKDELIGLPLEAPAVAG
jgi:hypothetical protein